jgi:hypothetical protein
LEGTTCEATSIPFVKLRQLNSKLNEDCSNFWAGYRYCVAT